MEINMHKKLYEYLNIPGKNPIVLCEKVHLFLHYWMCLIRTKRKWQNKENIFEYMIWSFISDVPLMSAIISFLSYRM